MMYSTSDWDIVVTLVLESCSLSSVPYPYDHNGIPHLVACLFLGLESASRLSCLQGHNVLLKESSFIRWIVPPIISGVLHRSRLMLNAFGPLQELLPGVCHHHTIAKNNIGQLE
jgi:hypothetical protein